MTNVFKLLSQRLTLGFAAGVMAVSAVTTPFVAAQAANTTGQVTIEGDVKVANVTAGDTAYSDNVNAKVDEVVKVKLWYHNREDFDSGKVAKNLTAMINIPSEQGKAQTVSGTVKGDNTNTVTDTAKVNLSLDNAYLDFIEGSASWRHNKGAADGRAECQTGAQPVPTNDPNKCYVDEKISDDVATKPAGLRLEDAQPCYAYEATVTVLARVKASEVKVNKYVSAHDGDNDVKNNKWVTKNEAKPGDKLDYMIRFENKGNTVLEDVVVGDNLPDYMAYVPGSTRIINGNNPSGMDAGTDNVYKGGIQTGDYKPGAVGYVVFTVQINDKKVFEKCGVYTLKNVGVVRPKGMNEFYNTAWTDVRVECVAGQTDEKPEQPAKPADKVEETPAVIPSTGPAALLSGIFGSSALALGASSYLKSRRFLRDTLHG